MYYNLLKASREKITWEMVARFPPYGAWTSKAKSPGDAWLMDGRAVIKAIGEAKEVEVELDFERLEVAKLVDSSQPKLTSPTFSLSAS